MALPPRFGRMPAGRYARSPDNEETAMAKGQQRSNKEKKKPKQAQKASKAPAPFGDRSKNPAPGK